MWRRIGALLCITCQYRAACAMRLDAEEVIRRMFDGEGPLAQMGVDVNQFFLSTGMRSSAIM